MEVFPILTNMEWNNKKTPKFDVTIQKSGMKKRKTISTQVYPEWELECSFTALDKKQIDKIYDTDFNIDGIEPNLFKKDDNNFFLINIKDYPSAEKEYQDEVKKSNEMLFNTYKKSFPNAEITQFNESKKIGNVSFNIYSLKTVISKSVVMKVVGYTSLYKGKDITLSAIYLDDAIGEEILKSINSAKFE